MVPLAAASALPAKLLRAILDSSSPSQSQAADVTQPFALRESGDYMKTRWIPQAVVSGMLLWALIPGNPYGYYVLLRWVCCALFGYLAFQAHAGKETSGNGDNNRPRF